MSVTFGSPTYRCDVPGCPAVVVSAKLPEGWRRTEKPFSGPHHPGHDLCPEHSHALDEYDAAMRAWHQAHSEALKERDKRYNDDKMAWEAVNPEPPRPSLEGICTTDIEAFPNDSAVQT